MASTRDATASEATAASETEPGSVDATSSVATGTLIGRYLVIDRVGAGGMGTVYAAYDAQLGRRVAIKVLRAEAATNDAQARLLREAQAMARLAHPNVLVVHDVGTFGSSVFIAMEFIDGKDLREWLREEHSWKEALSVLKEAGRGLAAAHAAGIVHRDFKPENVLIGRDGRVVVADFGIARALEPSTNGGESAIETASGPLSAPALSLASAPASSLTRPATGAPLAADATSVESSPTTSGSLGTPLTQEGAMIGTAGYMAPERAFEDRDDARTDQFSFGVTLYRALYGQAPFAHADLPSYLNALLDAPRPPPGGTPVPGWIHDVVRRAISYDASKRFGSMTELLGALERDPTRRRRGWVLGACAIALAGLGGASFVRHARAVREECRAGEAVILGTWGPAARGEVEAAIDSTGIPGATGVASRTTRVLEEWSAAWARAHREALEATLLRGDESAATMNDRALCREAEREELASLVGILSRTDARVASHAVAAAYDLPQPRACLEKNVARAGLSLPDAPEARARVLALRSKVAEVTQLDAATKYEDAIAAATRALAEARAIPHRRSEAQLLMSLGHSQLELGDPQTATATWQSAFAAAEAAGDDSLAAVIAARIAFEMDDLMAKPHDAERWLAIARAIFEREGSDDERVESWVLEGEIAVTGVAGQLDRAITMHDKLIALLIRMYGPVHPRVAAAINNKAVDLYSFGRLELSVAEYRRSMLIEEEVVGPDSPALAPDWSNLGGSLTLLGRYVEARAALDQSLKMVGPLDPSNPNAAVTLASMGVLDNRVGRVEEALAETGQGIAIVDATGDKAAVFLPSLLVEHGRALLSKGDAASARTTCARALAEQEKQEVVRPEQVYADDALTCLGRAETELGRIDDAIAHLERGLTLTKRVTPTDLALARFALAKALRAGKRDPARARDLATQALDALRATNGMERFAIEVTAWLARK
ncbi:MAG: protein kinase domain-containing protein [Polyangiaceae bacterium]